MSDMKRCNNKTKDGLVLRCTMHLDTRTFYSDYICINTGLVIRLTQYCDLLVTHRPLYVNEKYFFKIFWKILNYLFCIPYRSLYISKETFPKSFGDISLLARTCGS